MRSVYDNFGDTNYSALSLNVNKIVYYFVFFQSPNTTNSMSDSMLWAEDATNPAHSNQTRR